MRKLIFILLAGLLLASCEKEPKATTIDSVELYYRGRTVLHSTFHVPLKFYSEGELVLNMLLWSLDSTLESGRYTICPDEMSGGWYEKGNVNKTFSRDACRWRGELIKDGYVDVLHDGDTYTFDINLIDAKGKNHTAQYSGNVINKQSPQITEYLGFFYELILDKTKARNQENKEVDVFDMFLTTGDWLDVYYRQLFIVIIPESLKSPEGRYNVGNSNILRACCYTGNLPTCPKFDITSGTFSITPTNTHPPYRVDLDVMTKNGEHIKGSYINGQFYSQSGF